MGCQSVVLKSNISHDSEAARVDHSMVSTQAVLLLNGNGIDRLFLQFLLI